jgi:hypothetical protein
MALPNVTAVVRRRMSLEILYLTAERISVTVLVRQISVWFHRSTITPALHEAEIEVRKFSESSAIGKYHKMWIVFSFITFI